MVDEGTKLGGIRKEFAAWREGFINNPVRTVLLGLAIVVLIGLGSIAPSVANDLYSMVIRPTPPNPFSDTQVTYSNGVPTENDIIRLDHAGTLTPSPGNVPFFKLSPENVCGVDGTPLPYSQGMVLILNVAPTFSSYDITDPSKPARGISFNPEVVPFANYFSFELGTTHKIFTGGRIFMVKLSHINDLTTKRDEPYFSYTFEINEQ